ncbi:MAG: ATP synthase subunit I [Fusobacteriaceae bacterium]
MEDIKKIFKISTITSGIILLYGVLVRSNLIYIGMFVGSVLSILNLYLICLDAKTRIRANSPMKASVIGYLKRYIMCGLFLGIMVKLYGVPMLISSAIGLLNIKFSIFFMVLSEYILKIKKKYFN